MGFLIHGRHARFFGQIFDQIFGQMFDQVFDQGFWIRKYSVQVYWDGEIQCTGLPGQKNTEIQEKPKTNLEKFRKI